MRSLVIALALVACRKAEDKPAAPAPQAAVTGQVVDHGATVNGVRRVAITANADGYAPAEIAGKPGEKLTLVFTRTVEADCLAKLKTPSGELVELPLNKPVEVAVTVPASGELGFACGMDMFFGKIVAQAATGS
jgi:plastocyanin domain-containing protein